jgi:uncharacterized membrane protein YvlD (DUF360 family)
MAKKKYKSKLLWLTIWHRVVMLVAAYIYIDFIVQTTNAYGALAGAIVLNIINMIIYYLYHYVFLKLLKIEKGA